MKIITIIGRSGSGKTTLIEGLIKYFKASGLKISVIKHMKHDFEIDYEGKDTYRYKSAGATASLISNDRSFAIISDLDDSLSPVELARKYFAGSDIVIIEGYKEGDSPKIEVVGDSPEEPLYIKDAHVIAVVCDKKQNTALPQFKRNNIEDIAVFVSEIQC